MSTRVYMCYSEEDNIPRLRTFVEILRTAGVNTWFEADDLLPGSSTYDQVIQEQIIAADIFVYLLSAKSAASSLCIAKLNLACQQEKPILPIMLQSGLDLPLALRTIKPADFSKTTQPEDWARETARLLIAIDALAKLKPSEREQQPRNRKLDLSEEVTVHPGRVVVSALAPYRLFRNNSDNLDNVRRLFSYHRSTLQTLYLLATLPDLSTGEAIALADIGVLKAHEMLQAWSQQEGISATIEVLPVGNANIIRDSHAQLDWVLKEGDYPAEEFILDITAGTKAMSAAMVAAAYDHGCRVTYQPSERDVEGEPGETIPPIVLLQPGQR